MIELAWQQYAEPLRHFIAARLNHPDDTEDVLQEVFIKAYRHYPSLHEPEKLRAWLYQIARNTISDFYRNHPAQTAPLVDFEHVLTEESIELDDETYAAEVQACVLAMVRRGVEELPAKYRDAVIAADFEGLSQIELGEQWGMSYSGVKSRVQRGREQLRAMVETRYELTYDRYHQVIDCRCRTC